MLLPTALQLEVVVAAMWAAPPGSRCVRLTDIRIEDPVRLDDGARGVRVDGRLPSSEEREPFVLRGVDGTRHLSLEVGPFTDRWLASPARGTRPRPGLPGHGGLVYPPLFHGPAFQVLHRFGRLGTGLAAEPPAGLSPWGLLPQGDGRLAQLSELLFQSCGVWELAQTGQMMRPARIDRLEIDLRAVQSRLDLAGILATVWPTTGSTDGSFDGVVADAEGRSLIRMHGYRPIEFGGVAAQPDVVDRLAHHLGPVLDSR